ncbi:MAG: hypothetical protein ACRC1K_01780 [Planctomycetia bacterium]
MALVVLTAAGGCTSTGRRDVAVAQQTLGPGGRPIENTLSRPQPPIFAAAPPPPTTVTGVSPDPAVSAPSPTPGYAVATAGSPPPADAAPPQPPPQEEWTWTIQPVNYNFPRTGSSFRPAGAAPAGAVATAPPAAPVPPAGPPPTFGAVDDAFLSRNDFAASGMTLHPKLNEPLPVFGPPSPSAPRAGRPSPGRMAPPPPPDETAAAATADQSVAEEPVAPPPPPRGNLAEAPPKKPAAPVVAAEPEKRPAAPRPFTPLVDKGKVMPAAAEGNDPPPAPSIPKAAPAIPLEAPVKEPSPPVKKASPGDGLKVPKAPAGAKPPIGDATDGEDEIGRPIGRPNVDVPIDEPSDPPPSRPIGLPKIPTGAKPKTEGDAAKKVLTLPLPDVPPLP